MARKIYRSAVDGGFVTEEFAKANPDTTVMEIVSDPKEHNLGREGRALAERMKRDEAGL